ncbi:hypothetical protein VP01_3846g1 [Puccinia sorghi]|uniref:Uncharacterized protein n=1 Tax=Puccinia sorghi TaxID=27349 RepID=A0A0L6UT58_9BASI|nr:hypothetical protein VP01_3846g1 [Puccinia sorghi]
MIHQYIDTIMDVEANGHFGFQVIAWALGHGQDAFMDASLIKSTECLREYMWTNWDLVILITG